LERFDEYDAQIKFEIKKLKALMRKTETLTPTALGALGGWGGIQHECNETTKDHPKPLVRKGRLIECYLCSQNHFMRNFPMQCNLDLLVEEEARLTPTTEESEPLAEMVQM